MINVLYTVGIFIISLVLIVALPFAMVIGFFVALTIIIYMLIKDYRDNQK
jgi:membrane protein implicated in regulation of membrane protease activity